MEVIPKHPYIQEIIGRILGKKWGIVMKRCFTNHVQTSKMQEQWHMCLNWYEWWVGIEN